MSDSIEHVARRVVHVDTCVYHIPVMSRTLVLSRVTERCRTSFTPATEKGDGISVLHQVTGTVRSEVIA